MARSVDLNTVVRFHIDDNSLDAALLSFSKQAHVPILFGMNLPERGRVSSVVGKFSIRTALDNLLRDSNLRYETIGGAVCVLPAAAVSSNHNNSSLWQAQSSARELSLDPRNSEANPVAPGSHEEAVNDNDTIGTGLSRSRGDGEDLEEVVVTHKYEFLSVNTSGTTNLPIPIEQVPQSISLVSNDFIEAADLKTLAAIAEYTPGAINVGSYSYDGTLIKLRGFVPGQSVDGVNVANTLVEPDNAIYDRLEIVKGPSSVVYGISSPGGLVNYVTKSATPDTNSYLSLQAGSWKSFRLEGQIAGPLDQQRHIRGIGIVVQDQGDSFIDYLFHKRTSVYGGLNADIGSSVTAYLHGGFERQRATSYDGYVTEPDGSAPPLPRSFFVGSRNVVATSDVYHTEADVTWHATNMLDLSLKGIYQNLHSSPAQAYSFGLQPNGDVGINANSYDLRNASYGVGVSTIYKLDDVGMADSFVSLGALYQRSRSIAVYAFPENTGTVNIFSDTEEEIGRAFDALLHGPLPIPFDDDGASRNLTLSAQSIIKPVERVSLLIGVSHSNPKISDTLNGISREFDPASQTSYRAAITYELLPKTSVYVSYSESFIPQGGLMVDHRVLPPITGEQYEVGTKFRSVNGRLLLTGAAFRIREKNVSEYGSTVGGIDYSIPIGEVVHKGFEFQGLGQITPRWQINVGYSYLDPKITRDSDPLKLGQVELFLPKQTSSLYTTYTLHGGHLDGISFGGGFRYVGQQRTSYDGSTKSLPGYSVVDGTVGYTRSKWLLQLNVHNALNRRYFTNSYQTLFYGNLIGDPTNVALSIRRQF